MYVQDRYSSNVTAYDTNEIPSDRSVWRRSSNRGTMSRLRHPLHGKLLSSSQSVLGHEIWARGMPSGSNAMAGFDNFRCHNGGAFVVSPNTTGLGP